MSLSSEVVLEYWLSSLKIATVVTFIVLGVFVNLGMNQSHEYIGSKYWHIDGAPFVGGFGGFARVFVTASFACRFCDKLERCTVLTSSRLLQMGALKVWV